MKLLLTLLAFVYGTASAQSVTPVEKVVTLLEDLKSQVEAEGRDEATAYDAYSCFCKDTTQTKSTSITQGRDNINSYSASIAAKTATKEEKIAELMKRKGEQEAMTKELADTRKQYAKETADFEATQADLAKAVSSLQAAIKAMQESKPMSLIALKPSVERSLALADAMNLLPEHKQKAVSAFLQVDPTDPTYKYHSQGIIETLSKLLADFSEQKSTLESDWAVAKKTFTDMILDLETKMELNDAAMKNLSTDIDTLSGSIAGLRGDLVNAEALLKDDQLYLKDLTEGCEARAKDWDQRSALRSGELKALAGALQILKGKVSDLDTEVNERALLQKQASSVVPASSSAKASLKPVVQHVAAAFLQEASVVAAHKQTSPALRGKGATALLSLQSRQDKVVSLLGQEGRRLSSMHLSNLAMKVSDDPFTKVKGLIQNLIERLLAEATSEATKKGFCDTELGKAKKDREHRHADTEKIDLEIQALEIKRQEFKEEIELLTDGIDTLHTNLDSATTLRGEDKAANTHSLKQAKEGLVAVKEAIEILKAFYKEAAKGKYALLQASPVDEDTSGPGFDTAYTGNQEKATGIIGMLQVIQTDFERTIRMTDAAEKKAHEDFVEFDRVSKTDISGKDMKKTLDTEDLETTENTLAQKMVDLKTAQDLLDSALARLEDLNPTCVDLTMPYAERVAKREEEIAALNRALCILDPEGVESQCA